MSGNQSIPRVLGLRAGDVVEIRSEREILTTLDERGKLDGLPFMPEMLQFCGTRTRVFRRADKTCDTVISYTSRRLTNTVHLGDLRCDGQRHGGCQAGCLLFWKEAWLKPVGAGNGAAVPPSSLTVADLDALTTRRDPTSGERSFVCQATELPTASAPLRWWDPRQYVRELWSGNVRLGTFIRALAIAWFDAEMVPYCGGEYRVLRRVTQIIKESSGKMMQLPGECVILEGVVCQGCLSRDRLFCPRSIYPYWREIWLERVP